MTSTQSCALCGGPLRWSDTQRRVWCAVYGTHPIAPEQDPYSHDEYLVVARNMSAPLAQVVDELDAMPMPADIRRARRADYRRDRLRPVG